jgi:hypothetical protein
MSDVKRDYGMGNAPLYLSVPDCSYVVYMENNNKIAEDEYTDKVVKYFKEVVILTNEMAHLVVDFSEASLEELFGGCATNLRILGRWLACLSRCDI